MATVDPDLFTETCGDLLTCEICSGDFDYDAHTPRVLPCFHCFCETCLTKMTEDGKCQCPKCRTVSQVTGKIPVETTRMALLDKRLALQSQEGVSCESCTEGAKATSRCQECEEFLCEECCATHRKMKKFKDHTLVCVTEVLKNPDKLLTTSKKCERHPDKSLEVVCISCSAAACSVCAVTVHKDCKKVVEVDTVLDDKKKEMLSLCDKLDKVEQHCKAKAEESEASVMGVELSLNEAVGKVEAVFTEIINSATGRQAEIVSELRATAKADKLQREEQANTFRSLQAAAQTASQYGRRCVALSLVSQVFSQTPELKKTIQQLSQRATPDIIPAPSYKLCTEKLAELQALLQEITYIDSTTIPSDLTMDDLPIELPSIELDATRCGAGCRLGADNRSLNNLSAVMSSSQPKSKLRFRFRGSCATKALAAGSSYWQVRCWVKARPRIQEKEGLCEFGVATQQALQACPGEKGICHTDHCALTAWLFITEGQVKMGAMFRNSVFHAADLAPFSPRSPVDLTFGLLLDTASSRMHFIDVRATRVLCSSDIDLSTPVWPIVRVWPENHNGARVNVEVQSGQQIQMSGDLVGLLRSVLMKGSL